MVKKIYISSDKRVSGDESDFQWQMPFSERLAQETEVIIDGFPSPTFFTPWIPTTAISTGRSGIRQ